MTLFLGKLPPVSIKRSIRDSSNDELSHRISYLGSITKLISELIKVEDTEENKIKMSDENITLVLIHYNPKNDSI